MRDVVVDPTGLEYHMASAITFLAAAIMTASVDVRRVMDALVAFLFPIDRRTFGSDDACAIFRNNREIIVDERRWDIALWSKAWAGSLVRRRCCSF